MSKFVLSFPKPNISGAADGTTVPLDSNPNSELDEMISQFPSRFSKTIL